MTRSPGSIARTWQRGSAPLVAALACLFLSPLLAQQLDVNGYSILAVSSVEGDAYGVIQAVREAADAKGFQVYTEVTAVPSEDVAKAMGALVSWQANALGGSITVVVMDLATGIEIATSTRDLLQWGSVRGFVKRGARTVIDGLGYSGFRQAAHDDNLRMLSGAFGAESTFGMSESDLVRYLDENANALEPIEGIWSSVSIAGAETQNFYKLGIVRTPGSSTRVFTAFVIESSLPWWRPGDVKGRLEGTAGADVFMAAYSMGSKRDLRRFSVAVREGALLETLTGDVQLAFVKNYPGANSNVARTESTQSSGGTGFIVGQNLVATNFHVIESGQRFEYIHEQAGTFPLEVLKEDRANDLAILRVMPNSQGQYPRFKSLPIATSPARLGEDIYAIGFPLTSILGGGARVTDGSVSAIQGIDSDPRFYQVSIPIQPGNSGGPVLNGQGEVIGVITAQLNALGVMRAAGTVPQNVNFAMKVEYLLPLIPSDRRSQLGETLELSGTSRADQVSVLQSSIGQVRSYK